MTTKQIRLTFLALDLAAWAAILLLAACGSAGGTAAAVKAVTTGTADTPTTGSAGTAQPVAQTLPQGFYTGSGKYAAIVGKFVLQDIFGIQAWAPSSGFAAEPIDANAAAVGQYQGKLDGSATVLTVDADGSVFGQAGSGCVLSGTLAADSHHTFGGANNCTGGSVTGFGGIVNDELVLVAVSTGPLGGETAFNGVAITAPVVTPAPPVTTCPTGWTPVAGGECQAPITPAPPIVPTPPPVVTPAPPVVPPTPPAFGLVFTATADPAPKDGIYTLSWQSTADGCNISSIYGSWPPSGSTDIEPPRQNIPYPLTFTIDCHQGGVDALASVVVTVSP